jgi:DNA-binding transcriptional ArsR family regulator
MKTILLQDSDERLVEVFRALGHPARLRIVRLLMQRHTCICSEVVDDLPLAQATVSQHLKVLKEAGIIVGRVEKRHGGLLLPGAGGSCRGESYYGREVKRRQYYGTTGPVLIDVASGEQGQKDCDCGCEPGCW